MLSDARMSSVIARLAVQGRAAVAGEAAEVLAPFHVEQLDLGIDDAFLLSCEIGLFNVVSPYVMPVLASANAAPCRHPLLSGIGTCACMISHMWLHGGGLQLPIRV